VNILWYEAIIPAINIHTVAGKMQNTLTSAGTAAPENTLKIITVIYLRISKINM